MSSNSRRIHKILFGCALLVFVGERVGLGAEPQNAIHIGGDVAHAAEWTAAQLQNEFAADIKSVQYTSRGQKHTSRCIPVLAILKQAGVQTDLKMDPAADPKIKNLPLRFVIIVSGRDGYSAALSLAELLPDVGHREAWLALDIDGQPLSSADAPAKLIVPEDQKPARSVHAIEKIVVVDCVKVPSK